MALSFIGKTISLISHSDVRYRGILAGIDPQASTISLQNVYSMGTESRRPPAEYIPPAPDPYAFIVFKAAEVKDLSVDEQQMPPPPRRPLDDPAIMSSAPLNANAYAPYAPPAPTAIPPQHQQQVPPGYAPRPPQPVQQLPPQAQQQPLQQAPPPQQQQSPAPPATAAQVAAGTTGQAPALDASRPPQQQQQQQHQQQQQQPRRPNAVQTAAASLETVERALGDLRVSNGTTVATAAAVVTHHNHTGGRGGRRGGGPRNARGEGTHEIKVPKTDFDFESMNAKFDKAALAAAVGPKDASNGPLSAAAAGTNGGGTAAGSSDGAPAEGAAEGEQQPAKEKGPVAYNPKTSFFDTLSSNTAPEQGGRGGGRGGRGRGAGRNRREEEREKNVATFGEPGGLGLMGPGAYVGGWGGYGRRGGGRGRGRGGRGGGHAARDNNQAIPARG
ncbi:hypothetical protein CC1G_10559 [Coprinopsis cinerea okayama7|uniref:G2/M phase checkpoint control protein Sum2 n=1 Tax=Coprinopsis cinerea (strain Okayama-7 / 130 / ATCC MYA-4618 / FGSC 9003) TaxID=240176 RepID=A8NDX3_COPC7|nr:hypothetical protein CC1G_10559 [Coprinopsis cinerea okayama7\|eukprot:XP_001832883.1 hypothetical protein CC1G_10559 [Coprinopsis cinerea okayama7\